MVSHLVSRSKLKCYTLTLASLSLPVSKKLIKTLISHSVPLALA